MKYDAVNEVFFPLAVQLGCMQDRNYAFFRVSTVLVANNAYIEVELNHCNEEEPNQNESFDKVQESKLKPNLEVNLTDLLKNKDIQSTVLAIALWPLVAEVDKELEALVKSCAITVTGEFSHTRSNKKEKEPDNGKKPPVAKPFNLEGNMENMDMANLQLSNNASKKAVSSIMIGKSLLLDVPSNMVGKSLLLDVPSKDLSIIPSVPSLHQPLVGPLIVPQSVYNQGYSVACSCSRLESRTFSVRAESFSEQGESLDCLVYSYRVKGSEEEVVVKEVSYKVAYCCCSLCILILIYIYIFVEYPYSILCACTSC